MNRTLRQISLVFIVGLLATASGCGGGFNSGGRDECTVASPCAAADKVCCGGFCVEPTSPLCGVGGDVIGGDSVSPVDTYTCTPQCAGRVCGDDGCGGTCGACTEANTYCAQGACAAGQPPVCVWGTHTWGDGCVWGP